MLAKYKIIFLKSFADRVPSYSESFVLYKLLLNRIESNQRQWIPKQIILKDSHPLVDAYKCIFSQHRNYWHPWERWVVVNLISLRKYFTIIVTQGFMTQLLEESLGFESSLDLFCHFENISDLLEFLFFFSLSISLAKYGLRRSNSSFYKA